MSRDSEMTLTEAECAELLAGTSVGRLAVDVGGRPDIFPINYVATDAGVLFRTTPGTKLASAVLMHHVAFEIDGYDLASHSVWSVVVKGWAREVSDPLEHEVAEDLAALPWVTSDKPNLVFIESTDVTGRRFPVREEVGVDQSIGWSGP